MGEVGPELVRFDADGEVIPHHLIGAGGSGMAAFVAAAHFGRVGIHLDGRKVAEALLPAVGHHQDMLARSGYWR